MEPNSIPDNTLQLLSYKIKKLANATVFALKVLACLGFYCEDFILSSIEVGNGIDGFGCNNFISSLNAAVKEGLVEYVESNYMFVHDQIRLAAYSLIPEEDKEKWHLWVGQKIMA
eukprot:7576434-Ditylum_brightwellii.AAC.1